MTQSVLRAVVGQLVGSGKGMTVFQRLFVVCYVCFSFIQQLTPFFVPSASGAMRLPLGFQIAAAAAGVYALAVLFGVLGGVRGGMTAREDTHPPGSGLSG